MTTHFALATYGFPYPTEIRAAYNRTGSETVIGQLVQFDTPLSATESIGFSRGPVSNLVSGSSDPGADGWANVVDVQHSTAAGTNVGYYGIAMGKTPDNEVGLFMVRGAGIANVLYNPAGGGSPVQPRTPLGASNAAAAIADKLSICTGNNKKVLAILLQLVADDATPELRYVLFDGRCGLGRS